MIQRIQTVYLLLSFVFQLAMFFLPVAAFALPDKSIIELLLSNPDSNPLLSINYLNILLLIVLIINSLYILVILFLYKNRIKQIKLCGLNIFVLIVFQLLLVFIVFYIGNNSEAIIIYKVALVFPLISAILSFLALKNIKKDEKLIRSIDRIR
jgi:hypothetical protein